MFEIVYYADKNGKEPVKEYIDELLSKATTNKDARIKIKKVVEYISILESKGTRAGLPFTKHIEGDLWELRPIDNRIFFFCWNGVDLVLLHCFTKKSQKTPKKEIDTAMRRMQDFIERSKEDE